MLLEVLPVLFNRKENWKQTEKVSEVIAEICFYVFTVSSKS